MSSNYSNEFHLPIDYYMLNCSSRVSPRRLKLNRLRQQISCPQQQTYSQTYIAQQVPPNQILLNQVSQNNVPQNQVPSTPRQPQTTQQVLPNHVPQNQVPPNTSSSVQDQFQESYQISSPFVPDIAPKVNWKTLFELSDAFEKVIKDAERRGIFDDGPTRLTFEQILTEEGEKFINALQEQMEQRIQIEKSSE